MQQHKNELKKHHDFFRSPEVFFKEKMFKTQKESFLNLARDNIIYNGNLIRALITLVQESATNIELAIAASNAVTLLNYAGVELTAHNLRQYGYTSWRGARIRGADLIFAKLCGLDLSQADLRDVSIYMADTTGWQINEALVENLRTGFGNLFDINRELGYLSSGGETGFKYSRQPGKVFAWDSKHLEYYDLKTGKSLSNISHFIGEDIRVGAFIENPHNQQFQWGGIKVNYDCSLSVGLFNLDGSQEMSIGLKSADVRVDPTFTYLAACGYADEFYRLVVFRISDHSKVYDYQLQSVKMSSQYSFDFSHDGASIILNAQYKNPDGSVSYEAQDSLQVYNLNDGYTSSVHYNELNIRLLSANNCLYDFSNKHKEVRLWQLPDCHQVNSFKIDAYDINDDDFYVYLKAVDPKGRYVAITNVKSIEILDDEGFSDYKQEQYLSLFSIKDKRRIFTMKISREKALQMQFNPDGTKLLLDIRTYDHSCDTVRIRVHEVDILDNYPITCPNRLVEFKTDHTNLSGCYGLADEVLAHFQAFGHIQTRPGPKVIPKDVLAKHDITLSQHESGAHSLSSLHARRASFESSPQHSNLHPVDHDTFSDSINISELTIHKPPIGAGGFGTVYKATYQKGPVAVKEINETNLTPEAIVEFKKEAKMMASMRSPYIIQFIGISHDQPHYYLVMELMPTSLYKYLNFEKSDISWSIRNRIAEDICLGVHFMHSKKMLHRDLKSLNVLVSDGKRAKLCDFGMSKIKDESKSTSKSNLMGTANWMAPELLDFSGKFSENSDIYAVAVILWEIAHRALPYKDKASNPLGLGMFVVNGGREKIDEQCPPAFVTAITWGWAQKADDRPTSAQLIDVLRGEQTLRLK